MSRWAVIAAGCVIGGAVIGFSAAHLTAPSVGGHYQSPGTILISADERTLTASQGQCADGSLDATETADTVVLRLHLYPSVMIAPGSCGMQIFSARLSAPLGSRQLIDGVTGAKLPSFRGRGILRPAFLPAGFAHRYDAAFLGSDTVAGASAGCTQVYAQGDDYDESIWISQIEGGSWRTPPGVKAEPITVRGQPGLAIEGEIEWIQDSQLFTIQSLTYPYATLSTQQLTAIGDSLS